MGSCRGWGGGVVQAVNRRESRASCWEGLREGVQGESRACFPSSRRRENDRGGQREVQGGPHGPHVSAGKLKEQRWEHVVGRKWDSRLGGSAEGTPAHQQSWNVSGIRLWVPVKTLSRRELNETSLTEPSTRM